MRRSKTAGFIIMLKPKQKKIKVLAINSVNNLFCKTGIENAYRRAFLDGLGGSCKEITWDKEQHIHKCCQSRQPWRHKVNCPRLKKVNFKRKQIYLTDPILLEIKKYKNEGKTSLEISKILNLELSKVNKIFIN